MLDLKVKDFDILQFLKNYFGVQSIQEATDYIKTTKINKQLFALKTYSIQKGMTLLEWRRYETKHHIREQLGENEKLLDMSPEKLLAFFDKQ